MNNIKTFDNFTKSSINENTNNIILENIDINLILEEAQYKEYKFVAKRILDDLKLNLLFVATFSVSIEAFYPFMNKIISGQYSSLNFNTTQIVLITICALATLFNERQEHIKKLKLEANRNKISDEIIENAISKIEAFKNFMNIIGKNFNKVITTTSDMFAYTALMVPIIHVIVELINTHTLDTSEFLNLLVCIGVGSLTLAAKHLIIKLSRKIVFKVSNLFKIQNKDNIKPLIVNDEFKTKQLD